MEHPFFFKGFLVGIDAFISIFFFEDLGLVLNRLEQHIWGS